jgi:hypothetical protein
MPLTGRFSFRKSLTGKIVLQVEEERLVSGLFLRGQRYRQRWRDARFMDLVHPELRGLISFKDYVQARPNANFAAPTLAVERRRAEPISPPRPQLRSTQSTAEWANASGVSAEFSRSYSAGVIPTPSTERRQPVAAASGL